MLESLMSRKEVEKMVGLSYPTIIRMEKAGKFPKPRQVTVGRVGWLYSELAAWANNLSISPSHI